MTRLMIKLCLYCRVLECFAKDWVRPLVPIPVVTLKNIDVGDPPPTGVDV